jgi:hypothetical protein
VCQVPEPEQNFDEKLHGLLDGQPASEPTAQIEEVLAAGYSYQGRVVRRALVRLQSEKISSENSEAAMPEKNFVTEKSASVTQDMI